MSELVADGAVLFDGDAGVVWLPNALEHNPPANPNIVRGWEDKLERGAALLAQDCRLSGAPGVVRRKTVSELAAFDAGCRAPRLSAAQVSSPKTYSREMVAGTVSGNHSAYSLTSGIGNGLGTVTRASIRSSIRSRNESPHAGGYACAYAREPVPRPRRPVALSRRCGLDGTPSRQPPAPVEVAPCSPTPAGARPCPWRPSRCVRRRGRRPASPAQRVPSTPVLGPLPRWPAAPSRHRAGSPVPVPSGQVSSSTPSRAPVAGRRRRSAPVADRGGRGGRVRPLARDRVEDRAILNDLRRTASPPGWLRTSPWRT